MTERHGKVSRCLNAALPFWVILTLLATSGYTGRFGIADLTAAPAFTGRFTGLLMTVAFVATLTAAIAAVDHWFGHRHKLSGLIVLLGTGIAIMANATFVIIAITDDVRLRYEISWFALAFASVVSLYITHQTGVHVPAPKQIGALAVLGASVSFLNFSYTYLYKPHVESTRITLEASFGEPVKEARAKVITVPMEVVFTNDSNVGVWAFISEYRVLGRRADFHGTPRGMHELRSDAERDVMITPYTHIRKFDTLVVYPFIDYAEWLNPKESRKITKLVHLPARNPYSDLELRATTWVARKDRMSIDDEKFRRTPRYSWKQAEKFLRCGGEDCMVYQGRIIESNAIAKMTRVPRYVTIWKKINSMERPLGAIAPKGSEETSKDPDLEARYGFARYSTAWTEVSLHSVTPRKARVTRH